MLECLILGDSIAVGTHMSYKECVELAKGGINSWQFNKMFGDRPSLDMADYRVAIISLGSNDHKGVNTRSELVKMRDKLHAKQVFWILPYNNSEIQKTITDLASKYGDTLVQIKGISKDNVHPTGNGYKMIVDEVKQHR
jgi:lysophospholipase L1-like esterase